MWWRTGPGKGLNLPSYNRFSCLAAIDTMQEDDLDDPLGQITDETTDVDSVQMLNSVQSVVLGSAVRKKIRQKRIAGVSKFDIVLDTGGGRSVFGSSELLVKIFESPQPIMVEGIQADARPLFIEEEGLSEFGRVYYDPRAGFNILSFGEVKDRAERCYYSEHEDAFLVRMDCHKPAYRFTRDAVSNLYICNVGKYEDERSKTNQAIEEIQGLIATVSGNMGKYSKAENAKAAQARDLQRKMDYLSEGMVHKMLGAGKFIDTEVTARDVERSVDIFGKSIGSLKGMTTDRKPEPVDTEPLGLQARRVQDMHVDLMFVNKIPYMVSVLSEAEVVQVNRMKAKNEVEIHRELARQMRYPERFGITVGKVHIDGESAVNSDYVKDRINNIDSRGGGSHVPAIERKIRTIKERVRAVLNMLPYGLTEGMEEWLIKSAVYKLNLIPTRNSILFESPRERLMGKRISVKTDLKHGFGDYVHVHNAVFNNSMQPRTAAGLALMPSGSTDGSWYYLLLKTNKIVRRRRASELPMPDEVISLLDNRAAKRKGIKRKSLEIIIESTGEHLIDEFDDDPEEELPGGAEFVDPQDHYEDVEGYRSDIEEDDGGQQEQQHQPDDNRELLADIFGEDTDEENDNDDNIEEQPDGNIQQPAAAEAAQPAAAEPAPPAPAQSAWAGRLRDRTGGYHRLAAARAAEQQQRKEYDRIYGLKLTISQGIAELGDEAMTSIVSEMKQMIDSPIWEGVNTRNLTAEELKRIISSSMFLKKKYTADGIYEKCKARLVAGGHQQDRTVYTNNGSPTAATQSVFMLAALAAAENNAVATADVPGAFLKSELPTDGPAVLMRLNKFLASVLVKLDPSYASYIRADGSCVVRLKRALYGCVQSAKAWYKKLRSDLESIGYSVIKSDECVFIRREKDGSSTRLVVHVDDIFASAKDETAMDAVMAELEQIYSGLAIHRGRKLNYIGMVFDYSKEDRSVTVTMDGYIIDLLQFCDSIEGTAETPATKDLFVVRDDAEKLDSDGKEHFHTLTAKLLYLSKRVRPDILTAIAFLARRVQSPDIDDQKKLYRVVRYIRGTQELGLRLRADSISILAYVDASYGVHSDMRSHTGAIIGLGKGPIYCKSSVQKLNSTSSTEAELIALSDSTTQVLWTRNFLIELGYDVGPATVYQDNQSTIKLVENGRSNSGRTRHIAIRYFFVANRIQTGEIQVEYMATGDMIADILTKPLQGSLFRKLRALLMGWD